MRGLVLWSARNPLFAILIGLMFVGKHFDEATLYKAGYAFEQSGDWKKM